MWELKGTSMKLTMGGKKAKNKLSHGRPWLVLSTAIMARRAVDRTELSFTRREGRFFIYAISYLVCFRVWRPDMPRLYF